jgi:hypothetical protein
MSGNKRVSNVKKKQAGKRKKNKAGAIGRK